MQPDILNHVRTCVRADVKRCLQGCKYYTVYCGAIERYCSQSHVTKSKGAVNISLGTEQVDRQRSGTIGGGCGRGAKVHKLELILEVYAEGCEGVEDFVDRMCAEVQRKMCHCIQEGGACHSVAYLGTTPQRIDLGDRELHLCRIFYEVTYIADGCDMSQYKPMGCK